MAQPKEGAVEPDSLRTSALRILDGGSVAPAPFEIGHDEGIRFATDGRGRFLVVMPDLPEPRLFKRRAHKGVGGGAPRAVEWLVVELPDGVRLYLSEGGAVLTRADLTP
ncbi:hypothetical protein [Reyranella sp.]|uniref:hypothetical protein n=1 Tax=Reyranella sp. TaxID=1929291 RepID=UPI000BCDE7F4|nr:hypothetical protein [Reyranella sp.]OYY40517.1 MAG: hypothetical protein B7Y57_17565 [Rhodospirillales bacterium 35-66-84]OYZ93134.1 MAG: hypothetical protein B7Y08_18815 [Rhodospirillales bacterium 24-66-33]OZB24262.1 MAG: hypothetical protein B7X63_16775 [Rhodospirillales bacterium 39-66-50]HQS18610.1 hypothetical protein [Reyranella sp.]HQT14828.1 hypothetical protein [Reyranella sp.]